MHMICYNIFASINTCTPFNAMYLAYYLYFMPTSFVLKKKLSECHKYWLLSPLTCELTIQCS